MIGGKDLIKKKLGMSKEGRKKKKRHTPNVGVFGSWAAEGKKNGKELKKTSNRGAAYVFPLLADR